MDKIKHFENSVFLVYVRSFLGFDPLCSDVVPTDRVIVNCPLATISGDGCARCIVKADANHSS